MKKPKHFVSRVWQYYRKNGELWHKLFCDSCNKWLYRKATHWHINNQKADEPQEEGEK